MRTSRAGDRGVGLIAVVTAVLVAAVLGFAGVARALPFAYVPNQTAHTVSVVDTATGGSVTQVSVGYAPSGATVSPDGSRVYVNCYGTTAAPGRAAGGVGGSPPGAPSLWVISTATNTVAGVVPLPGHPMNGVVVSPDGSRVYVTLEITHEAGPWLLAVVDATTLTLETTVPIQNDPYDLEISKDGLLIFVPCYITNEVLVVGTEQNIIVGSIGVPSPYGAAISPDGSRLYVASSNTGFLYVVETLTRTVKSTVQVGSYPVGVAVSPDGATVYVTNTFDDSVSVVDAVTLVVLPPISVGYYPVSVDVSPDGRVVYVLDAKGNSVSVIETATNTVVTTLTGFSTPVSLSEFIGPGDAGPGHAVAGVVKARFTRLPIPGVRILVDGPVSGTARTDRRGRYRLEGLPDGEYDLRPSKRFLHFSPPSRTIVIEGADRDGLGFSGFLELRAP